MERLLDANPAPREVPPVPKNAARKKSTVAADWDALLAQNRQVDPQRSLVVTTQAQLDQALKMTEDVIVGSGLVVFDAKRDAAGGQFGVCHDRPVQWGHGDRPAGRPRRSSRSAGCPGWDTWRSLHCLPGRPIVRPMSSFMTNSVGAISRSPLGAATRPREDSWTLRGCCGWPWRKDAWKRRSDASRRKRK